MRCQRPARQGGRAADPGEWANAVALPRRQVRLPGDCPDAWRGFGHPQDMESGGRPEFGVCAAVDVQYLRTGGARAAVVLAAEFGIPVIGVAKTRSARLPTRCRSCTDPRYARCTSLRPGCPAPTRRTWYGAWPAGTGCPTPCAALTPSRAQVRPSPPCPAARSTNLPRRAICGYESAPRLGQKTVLLENAGRINSLSRAQPTLLAPIATPATVMAKLGPIAHASERDSVPLWHS